MFFVILMLLIVGLVAFVHALQGFFSATISAILAVFAAVFALSYHETIVEKFLGGAMADSAHAMVLVVLFAVIYFVMRVAFDQLIPGNIRLPAALDKTGGAIMGVVAGIFAAGVIAVAAQEMSFYPALFGYARYSVNDAHIAPLAFGGHSQDMTIIDQLSSRNFDIAESAGEGRRMIVPVDDIVVNMTSRLSTSGSLSSTPLSSIHPDWLTELFGQRLEPNLGQAGAAGRVASKTPEVTVDNLYVIDQGAKTGSTDLEWIDGDYSNIRGSTALVPQKPYPPYKVAPNHYLIVVRLRFDRNAGDKQGGGLVRIGPGAVRLVAPGVSNSTGEPLDQVDYYPIGTLQYQGPMVNYNGKQFRPYLTKPLLIQQAADDFLYIKKDSPQSDQDTPPSPLDAGADFVFSVDKRAVEPAKPTKDDPSPTAQLQLKDRVTEDSAPRAFIEVKRMVREDLSGHKLLPEPMLLKDKDSLAVIRRDNMLKTALAKRNLYEDPSATPPSEAPTPTPTPAGPGPTPTPTPATLTPTPAPPAPSAANFPLEFADAPKVYDRFYTSVAADRDSGSMTIDFGHGANAVMSVENKQIQTLSINGATAEEMHGKSDKQFITLAAPLNMSLVQVSGKTKPDAAAKAWTWKDQVTDLALVDAGGQRLGPIGVWVKYTEGGTSKVSGRFSVDDTMKIDDIKPAGEVQQVWYVFAVPHGTKIAKVMSGQMTVDEQGVDVP